MKQKHHVIDLWGELYEENPAQPTILLKQQAGLLLAKTNFNLYGIVTSENITLLKELQKFGIDKPITISHLGIRLINKPKGFSLISIMHPTEPPFYPTFFDGGEYEHLEITSYEMLQEKIREVLTSKKYQQLIYDLVDEVEAAKEEQKEEKRLQTVKQAA